LCHQLPHGLLRDLLRSADAIVDVRSPGEYERGHVAGAVNVPLFSNGERAEVGIVYKQQGKRTAIDRGLDLAGAKLAPFIKSFDAFRDGRLLVYCARGGMRSNAVVALLKSLGFQVEQLPGGYKAFRNHVLAELDRLVPPHLIVIHGSTGVGKTLLLQRLDNALDLEAIAQHRSSLFGGVNLQPRTQQQFDADLLQALQDLDRSRPVWVEGESRKVGNVTLPEGLRLAMQAAPCVLVTATLETRITRIIAEYTGPDDAVVSGNLAPETSAALEAALRSLASVFGTARTEELVALLRAGDLRPLVRVLLEEHYDPRYAHAMRNYRYLATLPSDTLDEAVTALRGLTPGPAPRPNSGPGEGSTAGPR
jgi:tRNA 2-selenouridine synthase